MLPPTAIEFVNENINSLGLYSNETSAEKLARVNSTITGMVQGVALVRPKLGLMTSCSVFKKRDGASLVRTLEEVEDLKTTTKFDRESIQGLRQYLNELGKQQLVAWMALEEQISEADLNQDLLNQKLEESRQVGTKMAFMEWRSSTSDPLKTATIIQARYMVGIK